MRRYCLSAKAQTGAALLITVIIVLVLSVIAVTATNTNQLQHLLVRSTQQKLLVQNQSYAEVQAQLYVAAEQAMASEPPALIADAELVTHYGYLGELLKQGEGAKLYSDTPASNERSFGLRAPTNAQDLLHSAALIFRRVLSETEVPTLIPPSVAANAAERPSTVRMVCYEFELVVESQINNTPTRSQQHQILELARKVYTADALESSDASLLAEQGGSDSARESSPEGECDPSITCQCAWPEEGYARSIFIKSWWEQPPTLD